MCGSLRSLRGFKLRFFSYIICISIGDHYVIVVILLSGCLSLRVGGKVASLIV